MLKQKILLMCCLPILIFFLSLVFGRFPISPQTAIQIFLSKVIHITPAWTDTQEMILFRIRLPRTIMAFFVGAGLSISGSAFQGMFHNPLVSPDILGVSSSAGFGAALAIVLSANPITTQMLAFLFGLVGVTLAYFISRVYKTTPTLMLVLSGIIVGAFFSALISITKYVADPYERLPAITFWLMGSLSSVSWENIATACPMILAGSLGLILIRWRINILAMGDEEAHSLGMKTEFIKIFIIICTTVVTAAAVSVCGIIGWVGLVIPHVGRMVVGPDHRYLLPMSISIGGSFMLIVDNIARSATVAEIPLGILTALIGAPFFTYLLRKTKGGWR